MTTIRNRKELLFKIWHEIVSYQDKHPKSVIELEKVILSHIECDDLESLGIKQWSRLKNDQLIGLQLYVSYLS